MAKPELVSNSGVESWGVPIEHQGHIYFLDFARSWDQLDEAKALDDLAFRSHMGVTIEEMVEISNNGAVLLLRNQYGELVGESQVITSPIKSHPNLAPDEAYDYGTAIHPDMQEHGLAQILFEGQAWVAIEAGKIRNTLTVRVENGKSIRGRFKAGYHVNGYNPNCYGPIEKDGARLNMEKNHYNPVNVPSTAELIDRFAKGEIVVVDQATIGPALETDFQFLGIPINIGDKVDYEAHALVSASFATKRFRGAGLLKPKEINLNDTRSILVLQRT